MSATFQPILFVSIFIVVLIAIYESQIRNALDLTVNEKIDTLSNEGTLHRRFYFYIGSEYVPTQDSVVSSGQMYVEHLVPIKVIQPFPIIFIPGKGVVIIGFLHSRSTPYCHIGMTGTNFLNTPDGRLGWTDYFLSQGYEVNGNRSLYFHH